MPETGSISDLEQTHKWRATFVFRRMAYDGFYDQFLFYDFGTVFRGGLRAVFQKTTTLGLVKLYTRKVASELEATLRIISGQSISSVTSGTTFEMSGVEKVF